MTANETETRDIPINKLLPSKLRPRFRDDPQAIKDRRAKLTARRQALAIKWVQESLAKMISGAEKSRIDRLENKQKVALLCAFGTCRNAEFVYAEPGVSPEFDSEPSRDMHGDQAWNYYLDALKNRSSTAVQHELMNSVLEVWRRRLDWTPNRGEDVKLLYEDAREMCVLLGIDFAALADKVELDLPEPKSWASLQADGSRKAAKKKPAPKPKKKAKAKRAGKSK